MKKLHYDIMIIGFGKGGKTLAGRFASMGKKIALIEKDSLMYGGTCINVGCIPSKSLILSGLKLSPTASIEEKNDAYRNAVKEKERLTAILRKNNYNKLASLDNVTVFTASARFTGPMQVEISSTENSITEGDNTVNPITLTAKKIIINTGSSAFIPPIEGLRDDSGNLAKGIYTSAELMSLDTLPKKLVIIGGGYIGLEFASMYNSFGSHVTVIQDGKTLLPREDEDIADNIKTILQNNGVQFILGAQVKKIHEGPLVKISHHGSEKSLEADAVLIATGRQPNTAGLNCGAAGVKLTDRGAVIVDEHMHTDADNIWAVGDVTGGLQHTYVSLDDSRIVWSQLFEDKHYSSADRSNVPYSVFLSTPYSRVGLNEKEALKAEYNIKIASLSAASIPKAQVLNAPQGILKAVIDKDTNLILGAMLMCEESYEMINIVKTAMDMKADYKVLRDQIFTHPTMSESLNDLFNI